PHPLLRRQVTEHIRLLMIDSAHGSFLTHHAVDLKLLFQHPAREQSLGTRVRKTGRLCSMNRSAF
ncbi:MAG: hypothetical protein WBE76_14160, partial [Terracidiphilus sp.]